MCIPHAPTTIFKAERREKKEKKHIEFDEKRLKADPDFVDERVHPYHPEERPRNFFERLIALFS